MKLRLIAFTLLTAWFALGLAGVMPSQAQSYSITVLAPMPGNGVQPSPNTETTGYALNNLGQAVGESDVAGSEYVWGVPSNTATLWSNGKSINLGTLGLRGAPPGCTTNLCYDTSTATAISNSGQIAGFESAYARSTVPDHAFLFTNGKMTDIHNDSLFPQGTWAAAINASGQVVGRGRLADYTDRPFLFSNGAMVDLGALPGGTSAFATDINDAGQVVGVSNALGFLFSNGQMTAIPLPANATQIFGLHINRNGQIAAMIKGSNFEHIGVFSNGAWTDLGAPAGTTQVQLRGFNLSGQVLAWALIPGNYAVRPRIPAQTFNVLLVNGAWVDLNTLLPANSGFTIINTVGINDSGQILCIAAAGGSGLTDTLMLTPK
jgi:probable HAF family extracellular repeat protein